MLFGLLGGAVGLVSLGLAGNGLAFTLAILPNALWGFAMPTLQSLMTRLVSESEQGQLQGANMSVASIAGIVSPLFFGFVYAASIDPTAPLPHPGTAFLVAAAILLTGAIIGYVAGERAESKKAR